MNTVGFGDVPEWLIDEVNKARTGLGLPAAWFVSVSISDKPHGMDDRDGAAFSDPNLMHASLEFKPDVREHDSTLIWHEVAHVLLSPVMDMARHGVNEIDNKRLAQFVMARLIDTEEQFIANLMRGVMVNV